MLETFECWAVWGSMTLLGGFCLAVLAVIGWKRLEHWGRMLQQLRLMSRVVAVALIVVCVMRGATKDTNSPPAGLMGPPMGMVMTGNFGEADNLPTNGWREVSRSTNALPASTFAMPTNGRVWEDALACGVLRGYWRVPIGGWSFSNTNRGWTNGFMWAEGQFRPRVESKLDGVQVFDHNLALAPFANWARYGLDASLCWCATNSVGGLIGTYVGAAIDDDPAKIVNAQFEFFPNDGRLSLRYDLSRVGEGAFMVGPFESGTSYRTAIFSNVSEVVFQRVHPDDWDMDGLPNGIDNDPRVAYTNAGWNQSAEWAARSFPSNATEIAAAGGYVAWAMARGAQPNRHLIGLEISSPSNIWPICLTFGDKQVMCNGKEEIVFAIDAGARYAFSLSAGELQFVTLHSANPVTEPCFTYGYPCERWAGDVVTHLDSPSTGWVGSVAEVIVDDSGLTHFYPNDSRQVTAVVTNCHDDAYIGCEWHHGGNITFSDPHSLSTRVTWDGGDVWATNYVELVTMYEGGYSITNTTVFTVGTQLEPNTEFSVSCQKVFFLNDSNFLNGGGLASNRFERIRPVTMRLKAARGVGGYVTIDTTGEAAAVLGKVDENGTTNKIEATTRIPLDISQDSVSREGSYEIVASCPRLGRGSIVATFVRPGQEGSISNRVCCHYQVVEPIRRSVMVESAGFMNIPQIMNPSRLVAGTNAVLGVGVNVAANDSFSLTNVKWRVVYGPASISCTNVTERYSAVVVNPTSCAGDVVVEARFNEDEIQPKFVLPIVEPRVIPVKAFLVTPPVALSKESWTSTEVTGWLGMVNYIFRQVGVRFELAGEVETIPQSEQFWSLQVERWGGWVLDWNWVPIKRRRVTADHALELLNHYVNNDCIELYFLGEVTSECRPGMKACKIGHAAIISKEVDYVALAHEIGHVLGLLDCYDQVPVKGGKYMDDVGCNVSRSLFESVSDWGDESGRGFYGPYDSKSSILRKMLMYGFVDGIFGVSGLDIPDGAVKALTSNAEYGSDIQSVPVGASQIEPSNEKVFAK